MSLPLQMRGPNKDITRNTLSGLGEHNGLSGEKLDKTMIDQDTVNSDDLDVMLSNLASMKIEKLPEQIMQKNTTNLISTPQNNYSSSAKVSSENTKESVSLLSSSLEMNDKKSSSSLNHDQNRSKVENIDAASNLSSIWKNISQLSSSITNTQSLLSNPKTFNANQIPFGNKNDNSVKSSANDSHSQFLSPKNILEPNAQKNQDELEHLPICPKLPEIHSFSKGNSSTSSLSLGNLAVPTTSVSKSDNAFLPASNEKTSHISSNNFNNLMYPFPSPKPIPSPSPMSNDLIHSKLDPLKIAESQPLPSLPSPTYFPTSGLQPDMKNNKDSISEKKEVIFSKPIPTLPQFSVSPHLGDHIEINKSTVIQRHLSAPPQLPSIEIAPLLGISPPKKALVVANLNEELEASKPEAPILKTDQILTLPKLEQGDSTKPPAVNINLFEGMPSNNDIKKPKVSDSSVTSERIELSAADSNSNDFLQIKANIQLGSTNRVSLPYINTNETSILEESPLNESNKITNDTKDPKEEIKEETLNENKEEFKGEIKEEDTLPKLDLEIPQLPTELNPNSISTMPIISGMLPPLGRLPPLGMLPPLDQLPNMSLDFNNDLQIHVVPEEDSSSCDYYSDDYYEEEDYSEESEEVNDISNKKEEVNEDFVKDIKDPRDMEAKDRVIFDEAAIRLPSLNLPSELLQAPNKLSALSGFLPRARSYYFTQKRIVFKFLDRLFSKGITPDLLQTLEWRRLRMPDEPLVSDDSFEEEEMNKYSINALRFSNLNSVSCYPSISHRKIIEIRK